MSLFEFILKCKSAMLPESAVRTPSVSSLYIRHHASSLWASRCRVRILDVLGQACSISAPKDISQTSHSYPRGGWRKEANKMQMSPHSFPLGSAVEIPPLGDGNTQS